MAYDFPNSPTTGQIATGPGGIQWQWDGAKWVVVGSSSTGFAPINSPQFTGDPQAPTPAYGDNDQSIPNTSFVQSAVTPLTHNVGRNLADNALFNIQQRGAGPWTTAGYTADRWSLASATDTVSVLIVSLADIDRAQIGDEAAIYAWQNTFTGNSAAGAYNEFVHKIEKVRRLAGKTVTVSFWALSPQSIKLGLNGYQFFGTGGSPSAAVGFQTVGNVVTLASSWARYQTSFTIPSAAGKTLGSNGDDYTTFQFWMSSGATNNPTAGNIGVQSGAIQCWGIQIEIGSQATPLEKLPPQMDLARCQRFYQANYMNWGGYMSASGQFAWMAFPCTMRANPTINFAGSGVSGVATNFTTGNVGPSGWVPNMTVSGAGQFAAGATILASADL